MKKSTDKTACWYTLTPQALTSELRSDSDRGLPEHEAQRRLVDGGPNELPEAPPPSPLKLLASQFSSLIIWVLIGAAIISGLLEDWVDTGAILMIVMLNAILGFVQEYRAERSLAALRQLSITTARVIREGAIRSIPARELVPGDLIQVEAGDHVPADARLVYATALRTQEAALTGESMPIDKSAAALALDLRPDEAVALADRANMLFLGTHVTAGKGRALVVATGVQTELGRIATLMRGAARETTPLQRRLEQLGHVLLYLSLGIVTVVFLLGLLRGEPLAEMFLTAVSLAVAAIPEGLPAIVTVTLALGVTRMVRRHALIRRLPAVETLGSTTVICTDKTGTLTKNEMTVTRLYMDGRILEVTGEGYTPVGDIHDASRVTRDTSERVTDHGSPITDPGVRELLTAMALCNGALLRQENRTWRIMGDPTEGALLVAAAKGGLFKEPLERSSPLLGEIPFDPERKMMTVVRRTSGGPMAYVKGAPDLLLQHCTQHLTADGRTEPLTAATRQKILDANASFAHEALRVLGIASRPLSQPPAHYHARALERNLVFLGLVAMKDPLRSEAMVAVRVCKQAGIRTVMITGDHKETAIALARELGILNGTTIALSGAELDRITDAALAERVEEIPVYARVSAEHKLRIVRAWKTRGAIVAMTGDGVNDAPAVKAADIGVAMGLTGTDVTKEASDMVVTDDNFASIAAAVEAGRGIYDNIRKAIHYLLSCNLSEVLVMLFATLLGLPLPLLPVQILWINLVTDGLPALALAVDPPDPDIMHRPPRRPDARILSRKRIMLMFGQGLFMALITILSFAYCLYRMGDDVARARTVTFTVLVMAQLFHAFNCRSDRHSLFRIGVWSNTPLLLAAAGSMVLQAAIIMSPWAGAVFKVAPFNPEHWLLVMSLGILPLLAMEVWKALRAAAS